MAVLLVGWLIVYILTSILGFSLLRVCRPEPMGITSQTEIVLAGLTGLVIITQAASLVWPSDVRLAALLLLAAGFINWRLANQPVRAAIAGLRRAARLPLAWLVSGVVLLFCMVHPGYFDSGLYHIPSIRWYEQFRVIPGLGNLHGRLAFNSSFFVLSAIFGATSLMGQTLFLLNGFTLLVFCTCLITRISNCATPTGMRLFLVLLLTLALYYLLFPVSSPTPDLWATLLPVFVFLFWFDTSPDGRPDRLILLVALVLLSLTVKLGTVPLLLFLPLLLLRYRQSLDRRQSLLLLTTSILLLGPWLIRNVLLSGYLLYPFPALDLFAVDWKIPLTAVQHEADYVTFWARFHIDEPDMDPARLTWPLTRWLPAWWRVLGDATTFGYYQLNRPLVIAAGVSPLLMVVQGLRVGLQPRRLWGAYAVALAGFLFWFLKAPEVRFGLAFLWMTTLLPWLPLLDRPFLAPYGQWAVGLPVLLLLYLGGRLLNQKHPVTAHTLVMPAWYGYRDAMKNEAVHYPSYRTTSGLVVVVPRADHNEQRCFEIEQPCSPYYYPDLEKRGLSFGDGFRRRLLP